jgi:S-(hydroxymethyl)glutathione dehydrogenase/alcohol dehydrogenase
MKTRAAVLFGIGQEWRVEEVELDDPGPREVLVRMKAAGLCHSDEHVVQGDMVPPPEVAEAAGMEPAFPMIGGHEGAGEVVAVGAGSRLEPGDHVAASFFPACGHCHYCATGRQNLCDLGAKTFEAGMVTDGRHAHHLGDGRIVNTLAKLGTFAEHMLVSEDSLVKVEPDIPWVPAALVSCGVATGWGSAVNRADVKPGDTVVVVGTGGVGMNAVQGAAMAGAKRVIAVDLVEWKREQALSFGATHTFASMEEAQPAVMEMTWGRGADAVIMVPGLMTGDMVAPAMAMTAKGGTVVVTAIANLMATEVSMSLFELAMFQKEVKGTIFGSCNPRSDIPELLSMYTEGRLKLDELVTRTYTLDQINEGYDDMRAGRNIRGVITFA